MKRCNLYDDTKTRDKKRHQNKPNKQGKPNNHSNNYDTLPHHSTTNGDINMDNEYVTSEMALFANLEKAQEIKQKIVEHGKVNEAILTGHRYIQITEEDKKTILENLDQLYNTYGQISNNALSLQAETVLIKERFKESLKECNE